MPNVKTQFLMADPSRTRGPPSPKRREGCHRMETALASPCFGGPPAAH